MFIKNKTLRILVIICVVLLVIIAWRIIANMIKERKRAESISLNRPVAVTLGHPTKESIVPTLKFSGTLDPDWQAEVAAKIDARIEKVFVREGDKVRKGQILARFEKVDSNADLLAAKGAYNDSLASYKRAKLDYERYMKLYEQGAVSEQTFDNYRYTFNNAEGQLQSAKGTLRGMQSRFDATDLIAPADGVVYKRYYQEGFYAKAATPVFAIADISKLKITLNIPEGNIKDVAVGNQVSVFLSAYPDRDIQGVVSRIAPVADYPSHTFLTEVTVDNCDEGLKAGVYATAYLKGIPKMNVLCIPISAVVMRDDQRTVYVVDDKGVVSRRVLTIGFMDEKYVEILDGLDGSEIIVVGGQNKIREGNRVKLEKSGEAKHK